MPALIDIARATGVSAYIDAGANRWPAIHRQDAARIYRLALETAPAGAVFHAVAEEGVPTRAIAEVIGRHLDVEVVSIPAGQAPEHFGWLGAFAALDAPATSALTRRRLGWTPAHPGLIADLEAGHYFLAPRPGVMPVSRRGSSDGWWDGPARRPGGRRSGRRAPG